MSDLSDKLAEQEFARLQKKIYRTYAKANTDISSVINDYWSNLAERDEAMREQMDSGAITKEHYQNWRIAQEARGKNFEAMRDQVAERMTEANKTAVRYMNDSAVNVYEDSFGSTAYYLEQVTGTDAFSGISFNLMNESAVRNLIINNPETMPYYDENFPRAKGVLTNKDIKWGQKIITNAAMQGIIQGKGVAELANDIQRKILDMNRTSALRAARTAMGSAQNAGHQAAYSTANANGVLGKKTWMSYHDTRTRDSHAHLDGVQIGVNETFPNGLKFPKDPDGIPEEVYNCRCRIIYAPDLVSDQFKTNNTVESYRKWKEEKANQQQKAKVNPQLTTTPKVSVRPSNEIRNTLDSKGIDWIEPKQLHSPLEYDAIINRIAGGDLTIGSCASVGLAYVGQKYGYDVRDFRDGESRDWFSSKFTKLKFQNVFGIKYQTFDERATSVANGNAAIKSMQVGHEYYLSCGRHAAIVRLAEIDATDKYTGEVIGTYKQPQYLELQSSWSNGWQNFAAKTGETLKDRFGASSSSQYYAPVYMTDLKEFEGKTDFFDMLGYINTADYQQRKGSNGRIR